MLASQCSHYNNHCIPEFKFSAQISFGFGIQVPLPEHTTVTNMFVSLWNDSWLGSAAGVLQDKITSSLSSVDAKG